MAQQLTDEQLFCLLGCRTFEQYCTMRKGFETGACKFCDFDRVLNTVIWEDARVICFSVPEKFLRKEELIHHFIVVPKRHVRSPWALSDMEVVSMHEAKRILVTKFDLPGGLVATRFGDMSLNAGTVPHLHENIYVPSGAKEFRVPVCKDPADREVNRVRMESFAHQYEAGVVSV